MARELLAAHPSLYRRPPAPMGILTSPGSRTPAPFTRHEDKGPEARLENLQGLITLNQHFFVRNNSVSLDLNASEWQLLVEGDAVTDPLELTYEGIKRLPSRTLNCYLECACNHRAMFDMCREGNQRGHNG